MLKSKIQNPKSKINPNLKYQNKKFCHLSFVIGISFVICHLSFVILTSGCALIKETAKGIAELSTKTLEAGRKNAIKKTFNYDYKTCYNEVKRILKETGSYIYAEEPKKQMLAIYVSETDTTVVGIFFKEIDATKTQIEVTSPSTYAKEFIAKGLFYALENKSEEVKKGKPDAKKEMDNK